jgi:hypothetical protein
MSGYGEDGRGSGPIPDPEGGVLVTLRVEGETFPFRATDPSTIQQLFALGSGSSRANIPNGPVLSGSGKDDHNHPWSWHLDPG